MTSVHHSDIIQNSDKMSCSGVEMASQSQSRSAGKHGTYA
jgi:hypothetical protein